MVLFFCQAGLWFIAASWHFLSVSKEIGCKKKDFKGKRRILPIIQIWSNRNTEASITYVNNQAIGLKFFMKEVRIWND